MSATDLDTSALDKLDFQHVQPCEHPSHPRGRHGDAPAMFLVRSQCPGCMNTKEYFLCLPGWELMGRVGIRHPQCGTKSSRDETVRILRVIGS